MHHAMSGPAGGGSGAGDFVCAGRLCLRIHRPLLCRAGLDDSNRGQRLHLHLCDLGELIAWIIGWDLILEYAVSNMAVSVGFAAHLVDFVDWFGWHLPCDGFRPAYLPDGITDLQGNMLYTPGWHFGFNIPAFLIVLLLTVVLVRGIGSQPRPTTLW